MSEPSNISAVTEGLRLLQTGDTLGAVAVLEQAAAQNPNDGSAFQYLGVARTQTGDFAGGVSALRRAAELLPSTASVWFNMGIALNRAGNVEDARDALGRALSLDPSNEKARAALNALPRPAPSPYAPPTYAPYTPTPPASGVPEPTPGSSGVYSPYAPYSPSATGVSAYAPMPGGVQTRRRAPSTGQRIGRGLGWGLVYAQWWTLLRTFWFIVYGGLGHANAFLTIILFAVVFSIVGSVVGLIAALVNADTKTGAAIGVAASMLFFVFELYLANFSPLMFINVFFWFYAGRTVGSYIAAKIQQPVEG